FVKNHSGVLERRTDGVPRAVIDGGAEVVAAGDDVELVFDGTGAGQRLVAAPDRHQYDLGTSRRQLPCHLRVTDVPADHHPNPAEVGREHWVVLAGRDAAVDLLVRQTNLPILAYQPAVATEQYAGVIDCLAVAFVKPGHDVQPVPFRRLTQLLGRRAR